MEVPIIPPNRDQKVSRAGPSLDDAPLPQNQEILYRIFEFAPDAILLIDAAGQIIKANAQAERMFGYLREDLIGRPVEILIPKRFAEHHHHHRTGYMAAPHARPMGVGLELFGRRQDDTEFPVDIMLSPLDVGETPVVLGVVRDATERKRIEAQAQEAREMYIREIHHRVKNNLQVISSLLFLQAIQTSDSTTQEILKESQTRVKSIALIHEKLYRAAAYTRLDFPEYIRDLIVDLFRTYGVNQENISIRTDVEDISLEIDTAIPCGLLINELVSNVLKHAFPGGRSGEVSIVVRRSGDRDYSLVVQDNGIGLPNDLDWRNSGTLGLRLVMDLARQLDGSVEVDNLQGTTFRVLFRELHYKDRS